MAEIIELKDVRNEWNANLDVAAKRENAAMVALISAWCKRSNVHVDAKTQDGKRLKRVENRYQKCVDDFIEAHTVMGKVYEKVACEMIDGKRMKRSE
jgi:hypothetical protein